LLVQFFGAEENNTFTLKHSTVQLLVKYLKRSMELKKMKSPFLRILKDLDKDK
jgi:hypothetical protein